MLQQVFPVQEVEAVEDRTMADHCHRKCTPILLLHPHRTPPYLRHSKRRLPVLHPLPVNSIIIITSSSISSNNNNRITTA